MAAIIDADALEARAAGLAEANLNGFDFALVSLPPGLSAAFVEVHFHNANRLATLLAASAPPSVRFPIHGGHRVQVQATEVFAVVAGRLPVPADGIPAAETLTIQTGGESVTAALPAGTTLGQAVAAVNAAAGARARAFASDGRLVVTARRFDFAVSSSRADAASGFTTAPAAPATNVLGLLVRPVGDYSTYMLSLGAAVTGFDPIFSELGFRFRPGCFSTDCAPDWTPAPPPVADPVIDYLAKDYDSFRHVAMAWMQSRVAGWEPTSEADLSLVLISLISAAADELSDYQDRVMNEAYLATARSRVTLARHARLMDYHVHQGNQATTALAVELASGAEILPGGSDPAVIEAWTSGEGEPAADAAVFRGETPHLHHLLNALSPYTFGGAVPGLAAGATAADLALPSHAAADRVVELFAAGAAPQLLIQEERDPAKRQLLRLDPDSARARRDPVTGSWYVSVAWRDEDRLRHEHLASRFHGNLVEVSHGREVEVTFHPPDARLAHGERHLEPTRWGTLARLAPDTALLYRDTPPASETPPVSTLRVATLDGTPWTEVISLVDSDADDRHFAVETDELGRSVLRFGNGVHGENLTGSVRCTYQTGLTLDGNVGRDRIRRFDRSGNPKLAAVWNPFDVTSARAPEPREEILRNVPEAYRSRQLRAVTLADYVQRAEEVEGVSRAAAAYAWTGSWRTVRITIDPLGTDVLRPELRAAVARHLEPVRLIGEDLELRAPGFVPLRIRVSLCAEPDVWLADVRSVLEQEFSDGFTPDGRPAFFHPDAWTFGQTLHASQILGRIEQVQGVAFARSVRLARWDAPTPGTADRIEVGPDEIVRVRNDPDHMELGSIVFDLTGGRG